jgi:hypothetical protein
VNRRGATFVVQDPALLHVADEIWHRCINHQGKWVRHDLLRRCYMPSSSKSGGLEFIGQGLFRTCSRPTNLT